MRATAWWAAALLWTGWAAFVAHAWEVVSGVYQFPGTAGACRSGDIVQVQIIRLDPMPRNVPYNAYVPWGPFQDFETNYEQVVVPWPRTPGFGNYNYLDGIHCPDPGFTPPAFTPPGFTPPRLPGQRYPQSYPAPGQGYPHYRHPARGHHGAPDDPGPGCMIRFPLPNYNLECFDTVHLPTPGMTTEPCFPYLPAMGETHVRLPSGRVRMPSGAVAMPWYLEYADEAGVRMPTLDGVRMPTLGADCGPREPSGLASAVTMPQLSVLGDSFCNLRMPAASFQAPNPGFRMHILPRPVISIESAFGINLGSSPRGWDPSDQWYFPDTCVPQSVLGRVTAPFFQPLP